MNKGKSAIANWRGALKPRWRRLTPYGLCVHTTGRQIVKRAHRQGVSPVSLAIKHYRRSSGVHYLIDYDGTIHQFVRDDRRGAHVGISRTERECYLDVSWVLDVPRATLELWQTRWGQKSPQQLYPGKSPNGAYIGVELLPRLDGRFTLAQYRSLARLWIDICQRHDLHARYYYPDSRLLGHEDLDAYGRWHKHIGGWDPGALKTRGDQLFDWYMLEACIEDFRVGS